MENKLSNLWIKIGRMGRKQFFLKHLYMILSIPCFIYIFIGLGGLIMCKNGSSNSAICERLYTSNGDEILIFLLFLFLLSNFFLAKRFQDCGICGIRAFVLLIMFPINIILSFIPYVIVVIIMCLIKGDAGPNKYGNSV